MANSHTSALQKEGAQSGRPKVLYWLTHVSRAHQPWDRLGPAKTSAMKGACRWLQKRIWRYKYIDCDMKSTSSIVLPELPSLLAACAPSTQLSLRLPRSEGKHIRHLMMIVDLAAKYCSAGVVSYL